MLTVPKGAVGVMGAPTLTSSLRCVHFVALWRAYFNPAVRSDINDAGLEGSNNDGVYGRDCCNLNSTYIQCDSYNNPGAVQPLHYFDGASGGGLSNDRLRACLYVYSAS